MKRTAIILFNLGGPDRLEAVKPFLTNLFSDPAIIRIPAPIRQLLARLIAYRRTPIAIDIYRQIGGRSPILGNVTAQAAALEKELGAETKCFVAMRYWHPFADEAARNVSVFAPDEIILLPLYPQFSTTTSASSIRAWHKAARKAGLNMPTKILCCYPDEDGFIESMVEPIRAALEKAKVHGNPRLLFSAHGLPEKIIKSGDPYQFQCERTAKALVEKLSIDGLDWTLCYQSRVGPLKWIGPSTEEEITRAGHERVPTIIVPIAFVCENSETLYEIDILYRTLAAEAGVPYFDRVPTVGTNPKFISALAGLVRRARESSAACMSNANAPLCPPEFSGCACRGVANVV